MSTDRSHSLVIGFAVSTGMPKHDDLKGLSAFILSLADLPNVDDRVLGECGLKQVSRHEMPALYNSIDLYICASTSEGFSQSVLEASACGRGVLSIRVGGSEDLLEEGVNGHFIERNLDLIRRQVRTLEVDREAVARLGANSRRRVHERCSWKMRVEDWLSFMRTNLAQDAI